jgi:Fe-S-cluster containining protein
MFQLPAVHIGAPNADARRWIELHASKTHATLQAGRVLEFETRCSALTPAGRCGIYDSRPNVCRVYRPGGVECLATVKARRTPDEYARIRGDGDPATIHEAKA